MANLLAVGWSATSLPMPGAKFFLALSCKSVCNYSTGAFTLHNKNGSVGH